PQEGRRRQCSGWRGSARDNRRRARRWFDVLALSRPEVPAGRGALGTALGACGVLYLVGSLGVPGYGAAGLSTGLSALGTPLGGGIVAGITVATAAPALLAALLALIFYGVARWLDSRSSAGPALTAVQLTRSEEHTSELQS